MVLDNQVLKDYCKHENDKIKIPEEAKDLINALAYTYNIDDLNMQGLVRNSLNEKGFYIFGSDGCVAGDGGELAVFEACV